MGLIINDQYVFNQFKLTQKIKQTLICLQLKWLLDLI